MAVIPSGSKRGDDDLSDRGYAYRDPEVALRLPPANGWDPFGIEEGGRSSIEIFAVVLHTGFVKKFDVFFQICFDAVMFSLVGDVSLDLRSSRRADGKNAVAFLPLKLRTTDRFMNPNRG
jgi:hypothetical protein